MLEIERVFGSAPHSDKVSIRASNCELGIVHGKGIGGSFGLGKMYPSIKRVFDIVFASVMLLLVSPILLLAALATRLDSSGPVLFRQQRLGRSGCPFCIYKLRTMTDRPRRAESQVVPGSAEVTRVGAVLRRLKIDELPQLFNVLRGDMSLVGPRPSMLSLLDELDEVGRCRLDARPGLTGLAQVNGNIYLSWPERWKLDSYYVKNLSFGLDLRILAKTALVVFLGEKWGKS